MGAPLTRSEAQYKSVDDLYTMINDLNLIQTRNQRFQFLTDEEHADIQKAKQLLRPIRNRLDGR